MRQPGWMRAERWIVVPLSCGVVVAVVGGEGSSEGVRAAVGGAAVAGGGGRVGGDKNPISHLSDTRAPSAMVTGAWVVTRRVRTWTMLWAARVMGWVPVREQEGWRRAVGCCVRGGGGGVGAACGSCGGC